MNINNKEELELLLELLDYINFFDLKIKIKSPAKDLEKVLNKFYEETEFEKILKEITLELFFKGVATIEILNNKKALFIQRCLVESLSDLGENIIYFDYKFIKNYLKNFNNKKDIINFLEKEKKSFYVDIAHGISNMLIFLLKNELGKIYCDDIFSVYVNDRVVTHF